MSKLQFGMPTLIELNNLNQQLSLCKKLNLNFIELSMNLPQYLPENLNPKKLKEISQKENIKFTLHLPDETDLGMFSEPALEGYLNLCKKAILWSHQAGISLINTHLKQGTYFTLPHKKVYIYEKYLERFIPRVYNSFRQITQLAEKHNIKICLENCSNFHLPFLYQALKKLSSLDALYFTWDTGHDAKSGFQEKPILMEHKDKIKHLHLHDYNGVLDHQPLYTGKVNIDEALQFAQEHDTTVLIETKTSQALTKSVKKLKENNHISILH